uniref:Uncharacterized protein n=1 Tax=Meleagris gallopavo TaxID=9103 RepID=A0A803YAX2_MELGA
MSFYRTRTEKNSRVLDILISQGERACRLFFYPCLKQVEPKLYNKMRKYVSEVNESIRDARRQLIGYLLERDKVWFEKSCEQYQEERESPRRKRHEGATKKKGKETQLSGAAKPRKHHSDIGIFDTAAKGYISELAKTLKDNDINALNSSNETLLHVAASQGHLSIMEYLISNANVNAKDKQSKSPLHFACERGDKTMVEMLLNANADPNAQDKEKKTPLHAAALRGHLGIVQVLLAKKGRPGLKDMDGCTPVDLINLLLSYGAAINALDSNKDTPFTADRLLCPPFQPSHTHSCSRLDVGAEPAYSTAAPGQRREAGL